jgi:hypothetical protein
MSLLKWALIMLVVSLVAAARTWLTFAVKPPAGPGTATIDREGWPRSAVGGGGYIGPGPCSLGGASTAYGLFARLKIEKDRARGLFLQAYAGTPAVVYWLWRRTEMPRAVVWRAVDLARP